MHRPSSSFASDRRLEGGIDFESGGSVIPAHDYLRWAQGSMNLYFEQKGRPERSPADGHDSAGYRKAVKLFKSLAGVKPANDKVDEKTQNALILANEGNPKYLAWLRSALDKVGYARLTVASAKTVKPVAAIREFQKDHSGRFGFHLKVDGFVGARTHLALLHALKGLKPKPSSPTTPTEVTDDQLDEQLRRAEEWIRVNEGPERRPTELCLLAKLRLRTTNDGYFTPRAIHAYFDAALGSGESLVALSARRHLKTFIKARRDTDRPVTPQGVVDSLQRLISEIVGGIQATQISYCYDPRRPGVQQRLRNLSGRRDSLYSCPLIKREVDAMKGCAG